MQHSTLGKDEETFQEFESKIGEVMKLLASMKGENGDLAESSIDDDDDRRAILPKHTSTIDSTQCSSSKEYVKIRISMIWICQVIIIIYGIFTFSKGRIRGWFYRENIKWQNGHKQIWFENGFYIFYIWLGLDLIGN